MRLCLAALVQQLFVSPNVQRAYAFLKTCSDACVNAKAVLACQPTPFPLPVISSGVWALEREGEHRFPPHLGCQSSLLWCPAGTAAADRCQREGAEQDIELITTTAATNSRSGEHVSPSESLHHLL